LKISESSTYLQIARTLSSTVGWVDIGTVVKIPLNVNVFLKKVGKITEKFV
jgi:hypothetical protein